MQRQVDPSESLICIPKELTSSCRKLEKFEEKLRNHSLAKHPDLLALLTRLQQKHALAEQIRVAKKQAWSASSVILLDEVRHRERLLHRLK